MEATVVRFILLVLVGWASAQQARQCCVSLSEITKDNLFTLAITALAAPNVTCLSPLYWTTCEPSSCLLVDCTGDFRGLAGTVHAGFCGPNNTVETAVKVLNDMGATGSCTQRPGLKRDTPPTSPTPTPSASNRGASAAENFKILSFAYGASLSIAAAACLFI
jgi:hypothetical protein